MRTFNVLVEEEVQGWVTIEAEDLADVNRKILAGDLTVPRQRVRRYAPRAHPHEPVMRHGRVLVTRAIRQCGPGSGEKILLKLDCGHEAYIDLDLWFPDNPYFECTYCTGKLG
jgi:hypothetical protein